MNYKILLISFITFFLCSGSATAQDKRYRVEILVFTHLQHDAEPREEMWLRDFSESLDFLKAPEEEDADSENPDGVEGERLAANEAIAEDSVTAADAGIATEEFPPGEVPEEDLEEIPWADVVPIETMGEVMQEAGRRLRLSAPFRPEQYLSWEQSADEPFPSLRIHNQEIVLIDDPYADLRAELAEKELESEPGAEKPIVFSDQGNILPGDPEAESEEESELPEPTLYHQIDGTVMLRRSRFLHMELDLELREAIFDEMAMTRALIAQEQFEGENPETNTETDLPRPSSFLIHRLQQSRQVKTARMEYFDGPVLSVLAYISSVEIDENESTEDKG